MALASCGTEGRWAWQCDQACDRLYAPDFCGLGGDVDAAADSRYRCDSQCQSAWSVEGEVRGGYRPSDPDSSVETYHNQAEAELWMDCVDDTTCTDLDAGVCPPVF